MYTYTLCLKYTPTSLSLAVCHFHRNTAAAEPSGDRGEQVRCRIVV